jgi:hypothetical protein
VTIHVMSQFEGRHRGGRHNPPHASYADGEHSPDELRQLLGDPTIKVIVGGEVLTEDYIAGLEETAAKKSSGKAPK